MTYYMSAMVVYSDEIEAENEEEAKKKFEANCPYDIDWNTFWCEEEQED